MKHIIVDFLKEARDQIIGWDKPREGKLRLTRHAFNKMHEWQLTEETLRDVFEHGEEVKKDMIVREYSTFSVGIIYKYDEAEERYVIITCWKRY
jgi:hypothetical protein